MLKACNQIKNNLVLLVTWKVTLAEVALCSFRKHIPRLRMKRNGNMTLKEFFFHIVPGALVEFLLCYLVSLH